MKQTRSSISRLAFEVATCNHRRLVELLSAEYLRPTLRLQAAEFAIQFRDGIAADLTTPIKPTEPDWTRIPWYVRPLAIRKHRRELVQFRHSVELLGSIQSALALSRDVSTWTSATGYEFEALVAQRFRQHGYDVEQTGGAGDGGIDLEVRRADQRIIVQCKAHSKKVSPAAVRDFYGTLIASGADMGVFITKVGVSQNAYAWSERKPLIFLDINDLIEMKHPIFVDW